MLERLAIQLVCACYEATRRQQELVPLLARTLGVEPSEVFYHWVLKRDPQVGMIEGTDWRFFFHGNECWVKQQQDGRFLNIAFGPGGRYDTVGDGTGYALTAKPPWRPLPELQAYLAKSGPPYDEYSLDYQKAIALGRTFWEAGFFDLANPELAAVEDRHRTIEENGSLHITLPEHLANPNTPIFCDMMVCKARIFSAKGLQFVREHCGE